MSENHAFYNRKAANHLADSLLISLNYLSIVPFYYITLGLRIQINFFIFILYTFFNIHPYTLSVSNTLCKFRLPYPSCVKVLSRTFFNSSRKYHENSYWTIPRVLDYCQVETSENYIFYNRKCSKPL